MKSLSSSKQKHGNDLLRIFLFKEGQQPIVKFIDEPDWKKRRNRRKQEENLKQLKMFYNRQTQLMAMRLLKLQQTSNSLQQSQQKSNPNVGDPLPESPVIPQIHQVLPVPEISCVSQCDEETIDPNFDLSYDEILSINDDFQIGVDSVMEFF